jgi:hypothetical protein
MRTTIHFYAPRAGDEFEDRRDQRVRLLDHDEVSLTHKVEFADGLRLVVREEHIVSREVQ